MVRQLIDILESIEGDYSQYRRLEEFGQIVDRIMGSAKSLAVMIPSHKAVLESIGLYGELCKAVSYKASQVDNNPELYNIVVALLLDATEMLEEMVERSENEELDMRRYLTSAFIDRLKWIDQRFPSNLRGSVAIEGLLKALGV
ncbi:MAG: hypothetical protein HC902_03735 [Calothrix sp. SM1_5_4]|nr:hypothetical protein [Calothrix sp. SM1_5_4]